MAGDDFRAALIDTASRIGADPLDLATAISYETGGTFSPSIWGGSGGRHLGLIQFGPAERERYGANEGQSATEQLQAVASYLQDRGFKPGMGMADLYSTINAGSPGRYGASDAGNGGAPGTVLDKVQNQMAAHRQKAAALLGGDYTPPAPTSGTARTSTSAPAGLLSQVGLSTDTDDSADREKAIAGLLGGDSSSGRQRQAEADDGFARPGFGGIQPRTFDRARIAGLLASHGRRHA